MKAMQRAALIKRLTEKFPGAFFKPGEEFSRDHAGSIWTSAEEGASSDGNALFNYNAFDLDPQEQVWVMDVHREIKAVLDEAGWYAEFYDPGTVFLYKS